jgi:tetratricopeptide (TPR) repeat protein
VSPTDPTPHRMAPDAAVSRLARDGLAHQRAGRLTQAESLYRDALTRDPKNAGVLCLLGRLYGEAGRTEAALGAFAEALALEPARAEAHLGMGLARAIQGETAAAEACFRKVIALNPGSAEGFFNLGLLYLHGSRVNEAVGALKRAVALAPGHAMAHAALAEVVAAQGDVAEGIEAARRAAALAPDDAALQRGMGLVLANAARWDEALACYERALAARPDDVVARVGQVRVLIDRGDVEAARGLLDPLVAGEAPHPRAAAAFANYARRLGRRSEALATVERVLARADLAASDRRDLCYAAGGLHDALGHYEAAFARYAEANRMAAVAFDPEPHARGVDALIAAFDAARMGALPRATVRSERPVFVVGMPRSGTTLVEQILASHPQVDGAGELNDVPRMADSLPRTLGTRVPYPACVPDVTTAVLDTLARWYLERLAARAPDAVRVVDKMPQNFLHLGLIALCFPGSKVLHCMREPADTCLSCHFQNFGPAAHPYTHDLATLGRYYRDYRRLMDHWAAVLDLPVMAVRYEALVAEPERVSREMVDFLGLPWNADCLRFFESERFVRTASQDQVRRPVYRSSVGRWRHYAAHLGPLLKALGPALRPDGGVGPGGGNGEASP